MKRLLALAMACAFFAPGCGGGADPADPKPANGGGETAPPVNLEAECRAAADKWKTFRAEYRGDDAASPTITVALGREGNAAVRFSDGNAFVLQSGWLRIVAEGGRVTRIPVGEIVHAMRALERREPMPARGAGLDVPAGCYSVEFRLGVAADGRRERSISLGFSPSSGPVFGWLQFLAPADGTTIRAADRTAVVTGTMGRLEIDRDSGGLRDWVVEGSGGSRITATALEVDRPLDPALFRLDGEPADPEAARQLTVHMVLRVGREIGPRRMDEDFPRDLARACFRFAWREEDLEALAATGARRRAEASREMRASHPDISDQDLEAVSGAACRNAIEEALEPGASMVAYQLQSAFRFQDKEAVRMLLEEVRKTASEEVFQPAVERALARK
jgi:hypothetical protein